jgi:hypothetical protein
MLGNARAARSVKNSMRIPSTLALLALLAAAASAAPAPPAGPAVVINEIFYNAPNDLDDLQWLELHNPGAARLDLAGWRLDDGKLFEFPPGAGIEPRGFVVLALDAAAFRRTYSLPALGPLKRPLKRGGEKIDLTDAQGSWVDTARYKDEAPWPVSADGYSASLERICPTAPGDAAENWAGSPLPAAAPRPAGTPGMANTSYSAVPPPVVDALAALTPDPAPGEPIRVEAAVNDRTPVERVTLLYRTITAGVSSAETSVPMTRDAATRRYQARIPGQSASTLVRYRIGVLGAGGGRRMVPAVNDLRPLLSVFVHGPWPQAQIPLGMLLRGKPAPAPGGAPAPAKGAEPTPERFAGPGGEEAPELPRPPRGLSTFVHHDPVSGKTTLLDYITAAPRSRGYGPRGFKLYLNKDQPLDGMTAVNLVFEGSERFLLQEGLAYEVYRRAGVPAPRAEFLRLWVDGKMVGYHLLVERPNRAFLRRHQRDDGGNLYKLLWYGGDVVGQHEKKTHVRAGHEDVVALVEQLNRTRGEEQWRLIQESFNVDEVAGYFAVNMALSHWDGFFNNYFTYHDTRATKKWEIYPWDQDKTWGFHDGLQPGQVFVDLPLYFGARGAAPPPRAGGGGPFGGAEWWRPPGFFSGPLLANPQFRAVFLSRLKEILERVYTPAGLFPLIDQTAARLKEDAGLRARLVGAPPAAGAQELEQNAQLLKSHLTRRREFLLRQEELRSAAFAPAAAGAVR